MSVTFEIASAEEMRELGENIAHTLSGGDVLLLSGPLGAGKTTLAQGLGAGLNISEPIVSPTFTIARELEGTFATGKPMHLVHVDAYRLGGADWAPGQDAKNALLDELESLGLDEELDTPSNDTVVLMEWGEQMATVLSNQRLEIKIGIPQDTSKHTDELTSEGTRIVTLTPCGESWESRIEIIEEGRA